MKTKIVSLFLATLMVFSLAAPASASYVREDGVYPQHTETATPSAVMPEAPGTAAKTTDLTPGTVIVDLARSNQLIHVIWEEGTVVTVTSQFLVDFATDAPVWSWELSSDEGQVALVKEVADWLITTKTAVPTLGSFCYGKDVIFVWSETATISDALSLVAGTFVKPWWAGDVTLTVDYGYGQVSESVANVSYYRTASVG